MFDVQFITHFTASISYSDSARIALEGGCRWVQLRMKDASSEELKATAVQVQELCRQYGATFIIDDHVELVKQIGADGVHLGKLDMPIKEARERLGKDFIIGGTANTFEDIRQHAADGADYISGMLPDVLERVGCSRTSGNMPLMAPTTSVAVLSASQLPNKSYHPFWGWTVIIPS